MLAIDWSDADLVLANSTCFDQELLDKISQKCSLLKKGAWMLTLTKKLPAAEEDFDLDEDDEEASKIE